MSQPAPRGLDEITPHFTVSVLPYDICTGEVLIMHRGENVRSAKNCLAIPSGLLEHGESFEEGIFRELKEELGLDRGLLQDLKFRTIYRNQPGDGFDWVIGIWTIGVRDLSLAENMEPDKHDWIERMYPPALSGLLQLHHLWGGGLADALTPVLEALIKE
ncbi:MAG: NUDIX hydrolase [Terrimicrobiaceae bacterium]|jgi:8-oxo-dGTP pyrophosphatase MutT (NUDIX family)|nr:NUDIX hydrolase [Terrimicrobiaceae bacterium]